MKRLRPARPELEDIAAYDAKDVRAEVRLSANENPHNLPGEILDKLADRVRRDIDFNRYPDPLCAHLRTMIAEANGLEPTNVLVGNGGDELILDLVLAWGGPGRTLVDLPPTFAMYGIDARITGTGVIEVPRLADFSVDADALMRVVAEHDPDIIVISNPNNPTGSYCEVDEIRSFLKKFRGLLVVDEAYIDFYGGTSTELVDEFDNVIVTQSMSKSYSLAGLRIGFAVASLDIIRGLMKIKDSYNVDVLATAGRGEIMPQKSTDFYPKAVAGLVMMPVEGAEGL